MRRFWTDPLWITLGAVAVVILGANAFIVWHGSSARGQSEPAIDGIQCDHTETLALHIHAHLTILVNGSAQGIPAGIGIRQQGQCDYWLHTHTATGEIHVESPVQRTFTLGQFFDIWGQPLSRTQVASFSGEGPVRAFVNGKPFTGNPRDIPLTAHAQIVLEVGKSAPLPSDFVFPPGD